MGHFQNDYENASADQVEYFGQPILYSDRSLTDPVSVDATVYRERASRRQNDYGWYWVRTRQVKLQQCDQEIRSDGTFTIDDNDYSIDTISGNATETVVELVRSQAGEINRPGYRGNG